MKHLFPLIFIALASIGVYAQNSAKEKIESARIALITERLDLSPKQAEKFWPVYNEYRDKIQQLRQEYEAAKSEISPQTATEEEKRNILNLGLQLKEQKVGLEKEYSQKILTIISAEQLMSLRKAEEDFRRMLLQQIQKRRNQYERRQRKN